MKTDFIHDPIKPLKEDNILRILDRAFPNEKKQLLTKSDLQNNNFYLPSDCRLYAYDTITENDMHILIKKIQILLPQKKILWVGSSGIMEAILDEIYPVYPTLGLIGSVSNVTRTQIKYAEQNNVNIVSVPISKVYENEDYSKYVNLVINSLKNSTDTIIASSASYDISELDKTREALKNKGLSLDEINSTVQSILGGICRKVLEQFKVGGLFITGGDTSKGFFDGIGAKGVTIKEEIAVGVPLMQVNGGAFDSLNIITKAGAFGHEDLITYSFKKLREIYFKDNKQKIPHYVSR